MRETVADWGPDDELVTFVCERYGRAGRLVDVVTVRRDLALAGRIRDQRPATSDLPPH